ncbi:MAG TPA: MFS transporter [Steroidobacteraceae bacterium]|nr:MFS transporter [Steroidobacteraceae bacterium]
MRYPLEKNYGISLAVAVLALAPYVVLTTADSLYQPELMRALSASRRALEIVAGISTAGYAFGALLGGDLTNRFTPRRLFFFAEAAFILGSLIAALAPAVFVYGLGRVLEGLATGLLLVIALPPVIRRFPAERMPLSAAFINIGFFGAVTAGPLLGGWVSAIDGWRWMYGGLALIGSAVLALATLTLPEQSPQNPDLPVDAVGLLLGLMATVLPFWAVGELGTGGFGSVRFLVPLCVGLASLVLLLLIEYHKREPLSPVKLMWSTYPVIGTLVAMLAGAIYVGFIELRIPLLLEVQHRPALAAVSLFWPQLLGVGLAALLLRALLRTRYLPPLILAGMLTLVAGGWLLMRGAHEAALSIANLAGIGLLGLGAGATVSPALFVTGFALSVKILGRLLALVELVRSVADFLLGPVMLQVARKASVSSSLNVLGIEHGLWILMLLAIASIVLLVVLYFIGSRELPQPDITGWLEHDRPALPSPPLGARLRPASQPHAAAATARHGA